MTPPQPAPAAPLDLAAELLRPVSSQLLQASLTFKGQLDVPRLQQSIRTLHIEHPILDSSLVCDRRPFSWQKIGDNTAELLDRSHPDSAGRNAVTGSDTNRSPTTVYRPVQYTLKRGHDHDHLSVTVDHSLTDAAGLKALLYGLARTYNSADFSGLCSGARQRSLQAIHQTLSARQSCAAVLRSRHAPGSWQFPPAEFTPHTASCSLQHDLATVSIESLRNRCRSAETTVNDALLAAFAMALTHTGIRCLGRSAPLMFTVDLRQLLQPRPERLLANWSGSECIRLPQQSFSSFETLLTAVRLRTQQIKQGHPGLGSALLLDRILHMGGMAVRRVLHRSFARVAASGRTCPLLTNFGQLEPERLVFDAVAADTATLTGPSLTLPGVMLGVSSFGDRLTLSAGCGVNDGRRPWLQNLFAALEHQLQKFAQ